VDLPIRKCDEQQVQLTSQVKVLSNVLKENRRLQPVLLACVLSLCCSNAEGDIYRFVTRDGVETFTDTPHDRSASVVMKERPTDVTKQKNTAGIKTHDISLDEILQKTISAHLSPAAAIQSSFEPRLPALGGTITSVVGMRIDPIDGVWRQHNGIDIAIPTGTLVRPVAPGLVSYSGSRSGYGNTVVIEHDNGIVSLYAHNSRNLVSQGQSVTPDDTLALSGSTGRSTGPHLHFEAWQSGTNITAAFLPDSGVTLPSAVQNAGSRKSAHIRKETLSDGSILFTNIPASIP
jgi:murein DD-endopeptidase MepM/ murein hydrolase activator NlpD